jgi:hypothetical protein
LLDALLIDVERRPEMKKGVLNIGALILCCAVNVFAQDKPLWVLQIEDAFKRKELKWKIERTIIRNERSFFDESITLKSGGYRAHVQLTIWDSAKNAQDVFEAEAIAFDNTMGSRVSKTKLKDFGDENYIWPNLNRDGWTMIEFRKGKVLVRVYAPSVATAKRFAQYVIGQIPVI